jgi:pyruvate formate lyase activating enzyme
VEELVERVGLDLPFYEQSGGGVTLSGGEALAQFDFSLHFLKGVKQRGMHTALDTTGYADWERIAAVMPYTDLFLYDLKHLDNAQHRKATGVPNALILENARKIAQAGGKLQIRIPVIPQFNDSKKNIAETGMFCKSLGEAVTLVQLLPYHTLGVMKWERISEAQVTLEAVPPSEERLIVLKKVLEGLGLPVTLH